jgi:hypothetical protein
VVDTTDRNSPQATTASVIRGPLPGVERGTSPVAVAAIAGLLGRSDASTLGISSHAVQDLFRHIVMAEKA